MLAVIPPAFYVLGKGFLMCEARRGEVQRLAREAAREVAVLPRVAARVDGPAAPGDDAVGPLPVPVPVGRVLPGEAAAAPHLDRPAPPAAEVPGRGRGC